MNEFLKAIAVILEVEAVNQSDELKAFEQLDSLGVLSIIALIDAHYGVSITTVDVDGMKTVGDLWSHVQCMKAA